MHLGIDLGTSNSAVVGNQGGKSALFKTADGADVLPSAIYLDKRGHRFVGRQAYDRILTSPENVAHGFKRLMGTSSPIRFAGVDWTPEECSAEIIRTLLAQARVEGSDPIEGAVITIPAAFNQMQSEATLRAASAAGLTQVSLLQEPVAAAMASIAHSRARDGLFLVYDLGGGTFDVALVQSTAGVVNILAHEGINMLGGRDFDRVILDSFVRPWLADTFDLPADFQREPKYRRLMAVARHAAEKAKIDLSTAPTAIVFAGDHELRVADESGEEMYLSVDLRRETVEALLRDRVADTVGLCRKVLSDNGLAPEDVARVVLIGGPSKMPIIREAIPRELGIEVERGLDPMTAVAAGAAIFAESRVWEGTRSQRKASREVLKAEGPLDITFDHPTRASDETARLRVRVGEADRSRGLTIEVRDEDGTSTGQVPLEASTVLPLRLRRPGRNRFAVTVVDASGRRIAEACRDVEVMRTEASVASVPMTYTLALKVQAGTVGYEKNVLEPVIRKGDPLPAEGILPVRAGKDLRGGDDDEIVIEFFQQSADLPDPELGLHIGRFALSAERDLDRGERIRRGAEMRIRWSLNDSGLLAFAVEIPDLSRTIDARNLYLPVQGHRNFEGASGAALASELLREAEEDVTGAQETLGSAIGAEAASLTTRIERQHAALSQSVDADTHRAVAEEARRIRQDVALLKARPEHRESVLTVQVDEAEEMFDELRDAADSVAVDRHDRLVTTARRHLRERSYDQVDRALDDMRGIRFGVLSQNPRFMAAILGRLAEERYLAIDEALFDRLVKEGAQAAQAGDVDRMRAIIGRLLGNRIAVGAPDKNVVGLADLLKR